MVSVVARREVVSGARRREVGGRGGREEAGGRGEVGVEGVPGGQDAVYHFRLCVDDYGAGNSGGWSRVKVRVVASGWEGCKEVCAELGAGLPNAYRDV